MGSGPVYHGTTREVMREEAEARALAEAERDSDILEKVTLPTNVFKSYIILENLDTTEYNNLSDAQKEGVSILLSCGLVDLNVGKAGRVRLVSWFGAESTTVANLEALLE